MGDRTPTCCPVCNGHGVLDQLTCETICDNCEGCGIVDLDLDKLDPYGLGVGGLDKVSAAALLGAWHDFLEAEHVDRCVSPLDFDALMRAVYWRGLGPELRRRVLDVAANLRGAS